MSDTPTSKRKNLIDQIKNLLNEHGWFVLKIIIFGRSKYIRNIIKLSKLENDKVNYGYLTTMGTDIYLINHIFFIKATEAMLYTVDKINEINLIPGIKLGARIKDDCDRDIYGLEQSVDFIRGMLIS